MHTVERMTWDCIRQLMPILDPDRGGWAIDAGLGSFDFYCGWFHDLGYPTLAIEPAPGPEAVEVCKRSDIPLVRAALGKRDGKATLFHAPDRDLRSLKGSVWGGMQPSGKVEVVTLSTLVGRFQIERTTVLKLDIEGAEPDALFGLPLLGGRQLPLILSVEWGGEWPYHTRKGPWKRSHLERVRAMFRMLSELGYEHGIMVGSGAELIVRPIESKRLRFKASDNWGNAILTRNVSPDELMRHAQC